MAAKTMGLVAMAVLLSGALLMGFSADQPADAKPAKDSPKHKFSKWTKKVCGDELCPDESFSRVKQYIGKSKTPR
ncbi:MAG: hypothetical protein FJ357_02675 [Thaumarchaeota archaeon]|nr:hypothetical protein [Nitrososphaerota archaeon]